MEHKSLRFNHKTYLHRKNEQISTFNSEEVFIDLLLPQSIEDKISTDLKKKPIPLQSLNNKKPRQFLKWTKLMNFYIYVLWYKHESFSVNVFYLRFLTERNVRLRFSSSSHTHCLLFYHHPPFIIEYMNGLSHRTQTKHPEV